MAAVTEITWTNLNRKQANALTALVAEPGNPLRMPRSTAARVRMYYEEIAKTPVPKEVLAATGRGEFTPEMTASAKKLVESFGLDAVAMSGSGPGHKITVKDVKSFLSTKATEMLTFLGEGEKVDIGDVLDELKGRALAKAGAGESEKE